MNRKEVLQTLSILKAAYPHSYKDMTKADGEALVNLWERQFAGEDPVAVGAAVEAMISTRTTGFSPTIGEIKEQLHRIRTVNALTDAQAWALVEKACRRGLYNAKEEFEKLPADVQAAVGGPEQLKAWAAMDSDTVNSVVASNFRKTYRAVKAREKENALMPPEIKAILSGVADTLKISGKKPNRTETLPPPRLEPMIIAKSEQKPTETPHRQKYEPPSSDEWERKREAAMRRMQEGK